MTRKTPVSCVLYGVVISALAFAPSLFSQTVDPTPEKKSSDVATDSELVVLSPFVVETNEDAGYQAKSTIAGTRIRTQLKDVGSSISVMTSSFLKDTNSKNAEQLLVYALSTEVAGQGGNFLGQGDGPFVTASALNKPVANTRVRGLAEADNTRDFFLSDIPWDSYNVGRVDLQRGPNSILFGIGSPAGIVNSSLNGAAFKDLFQVENQLGSFGTLRFTGNFNKVILKDELAVRVDLLDDKTKFRQDPAFRDDKRFFSALKWDPSFLRQGSARTSLRVNFEKGKVDSNMPRYTPPIDTITPWFSALGKSTYDGRVLNNGTVGQLQPDGTVANNQNVPWIGPIGNRVYDGVVTTFDGNTQGFAFPTKIQPWPTLPIAGGNVNTANAGNNGIKGIATTDLYAKQANLIGAGSGLWKAASLTDPSIFDFYNNMLEGPNKSEFNRFKAFNAALSQTFLNDKLGVEVVYDHQNARWGNDTVMADDGSTVTIDINRTLLDGTPNPNVGRPMVVLGGGSAGVYREERTRDTARATAFADLNFNDLLGKDSLVAKIFGRNTFTVLYSKQTDKDQNEKGPRWYTTSAFGPNASQGNIGQASRDDIILVYVGNSLSGASSASGLNYNGIKQALHPIDSSILQWNNVTNTYQRVAMPIYNSDNYGDSDKTYTNGAKSKNVIDSSAVVWQGYWLDGSLIPMVGLRKDRLVGQGAPAPSLAGVLGAVNINTPAWVLPNANDPTKSLTFLDTSGTSRTYSLVTHLPNSVRKNIPGNTDISLFANQSENFKPEARRDIRGAALPSATGKTKEYGVTVTTLDERLTLKVIHYDTTVKNATISGALAGFYLIGANEWWGGNAARRDTEVPGSSAPTIYGVAANGKNVTWQPDATTVKTGPIFQPDGITYTQSALNQTQAAVAAAAADWFAHLAPADFQGAWEMLSTANGVGNHDGNFSPSGMALTGTTRSKGYEFEVLTNPIEGLDVSFSASKTSAQRSDLAGTYSAWLTQRWKDLQGPMGDIRIWGGASGGETTRSKFRNETYAGFLFFNALQGSDVPELNRWRYNVVGNYSFKKGALKGANMGSSYRWQDAKTIGFYSKSSLDSISNTSIDIADLSRPIKGKSEDAIDLWVGYEFKVYKHIDWRIQFNVRNVFAKDKLLPNTVQPNGSVATYRIAEPRTFTLTNTFRF
jgi:outer membrane receptor protein involved in Fe transport